MKRQKGYSQKDARKVELYCMIAPECAFGINTRKRVITMRKTFVEPVAEVVSFLSQDALMSYYDDGDIGGLVPGESGAGGGSGWGDF